MAGGIGKFWHPISTLEGSLVFNHPKGVCGRTRDMDWIPISHKHPCTPCNLCCMVILVLLLCMIITWERKNTFSLIHTCTHRGSLCSILFVYISNTPHRVNTTARLEALRKEIRFQNVDAFLIPSGDSHQGLLQTWTLQTKLDRHPTVFKQDLNYL